MRVCERNGRTDLALLIVRIGIGTIFVAHALLALQTGVVGLVALMGTLGVPLPSLFAWLAVLAELFGGILVLLGLATPVAGGVLAFVAALIVVGFKAKLGLVAKVGVGAELEVALMAGALALALQGGGWYALDRWLGWFACDCPAHEA